jgi:hypothetical protein
MKCISEFTRSLGLSVHHYPRSIPPSRCISEFSQSPSLKSHHSSCSTLSSKCISEFTHSVSPSASPKTLHHGRLEHLPGETAVVLRTWVMEVDGVMGSTYLAVPAVDRHHLISISSHHSMKIHTLCFPTIVLTHSVQDVVDAHNCVDSQCQ